MRLRQGDSLTLENLKSELFYDEIKGEFVWLKARTAFKKRDDPRIGQKAGYEKAGYFQLQIGKQIFLGHRLAYFYKTGDWPCKKIVKFKNGVKTNISWDNLLWVDPGDRCRRDKVARKNNKSTGLLGSSYNKAMKRYVAQIVINGKNKQIGVFDTAEEAHIAYASAKLAAHDCIVSSEPLNMIDGGKI